MTAYLITRGLDYVGLSGDSKPTLSKSDAGAIFHETDTNDLYVWTGTAWTLYKPAGGDIWL